MKRIVILTVFLTVLPCTSFANNYYYVEQQPMWNFQPLNVAAYSGGSDYSSTLVQASMIRAARKEERMQKRVLKQQNKTKKCIKKCVETEGHDLPYCQATC